jgi:hypothetical protein
MLREISLVGCSNLDIIDKIRVIRRNLAKNLSNKIIIILYVN